MLHTDSFVPGLNSLLSSGKYLAAGWPAVGLARVLLVLEHPVRVELIALTLNHSVCTTHAVTVASDVEATVSTWQPHLVILDMDLNGADIITLLSAKTAVSGRLPVIGLTRRGDLKSKLAAFEAGVDDILTVPFAPEELLARGGGGPVAVLQRRHDVHAGHQDR